MAEKFIQKIGLKKGALHEELHVPQDQKIPAAKLEKASHAGGKLGERARFAETLKGLHHGKPKMKSMADVKAYRKKKYGI